MFEYIFCKLIKKIFDMRIGIKVIFILIITFNTILIKGQDKFNIHVDYSYLYGFLENGDLWEINSGLNGFDINISGMYDINKHLSAGAGIGVEKLYDPSYTVFPIFMKVDYYPFKSTRKPYIYTKFGYGIGTEISNAGILFNSGLGYEINFLKHFGVNFMLGYHLQSIRYEIITFYEPEIISDTKIGHNNRHSISFGIGFVF